ncbi:MAG: hypothetical protein ACFFG0_56210 [Candidatus Thorarchaeota archaeon]
MSLNSIPEISGWKTKLSLSINNKLIPIRDSSATISTPKGRVHTVQKDNHFWIHLPKEFSIAFSTFAVLDLGPFLVGLQDQNIEDISAGYTVFTGDQWTFQSVGFTNGVITNIAMTDIVAGAIPILDVTMEFLNWNATPIQIPT